MSVTPQQSTCLDDFDFVLKQDLGYFGLVSHGSEYPNMKYIPQAKITTPNTKAI